MHSAMLALPIDELLSDISFVAAAQNPQDMYSSSGSGIFSESKIKSLSFSSMVSQVISAPALSTLTCSD